ncbi:MAG: HNH endonuclease, partial [Alphaproteobacteria bacterium]
VKYILSEYSNDNLSIAKYNYLQVEHIFSSNPDFDPVSYGFIEGYDYEKGKIGNLGLLEEGINKSIGNSVPLNKVSGYLKSSVKETRDLAGEIQLGNFDKNKIDVRGEKIIEFCLRRFSLS